jgi:hypothetical protein
VADNTPVKDANGATVTAATKDIGAGVQASKVLLIAGDGTDSIGEVQATPTANTLLRRLKDILSLTVLATGSNVIGKISIDQTTPGTTNAAQLVDGAAAEVLGRVTASPTANTVLARLKDLLSLIVLAAGTNIIGKVGIDQTTPGTTNLVSIGSTGTVGLVAGTAKIGSVKQRMFAAVFGTLTRPANTTAYTANDAVSNNGTAASVTAQTATVSDVNDDPISLRRIRIISTDTGLGGQVLQAWLFSSDPTASTGVQGGDNAAFSQKEAGFIGTMTGTLRAMFDGAAGVLTPDEGAEIITKPVSGAQTIYVVYKTLTGWTPSANSTTIIATAEGVQGQA